MGVRHGNKTTTVNVKRIGKHSELLSITDDPLAYAKEEVEKMNNESKRNKEITLKKRWFVKKSVTLIYLSTLQRTLWPLYTNLL